MTFLSIIIPVYNNEDTLGRCVESVLTQNVNDYEIIIVDDGSTDKSGLIADEWARKNTKITVIHKHNGGPSEAKNFGLNVIKGKYVTFVDSDDELSPDTLQPLVDILNNHAEYDILEYSVLQHSGNHDERYLNVGNHVYRHAIDWLADNGCHHCWMWNKIFKKDIFMNLRFPKHLRRFEDMWMMGEIMQRNPVIATTSHGTYRYYWNSVPDSRNLFDKVAAIKDEHLWDEVIDEYLEKKNMYLRRQDYNHPSFNVYVETVNQVFNKYFD